MEKEIPEASRRLNEVKQSKVIPVSDLSRMGTNLQTRILEALAEVVSSGWFVLGKQVQAFESAFASYCGTSCCVGVASGTEALELALRALGIGNGNRVATVANAGGYSTAAILSCGATPVYVDVHSDSLLLDVEELERSLRVEKIDAVIVTHLYGLMADMPSITALAKDYGIPVVEDCAQAHGASLHGKKAGTFGDIGCFSFYPTKNLGALGDAGAIVTNNGEIANNIRKLRQYGGERKYHIGMEGGRNSRLDEIQAAVLRVKLPYLDGWNSKRRKVAAKYSALISNPKVSCPRYCGSEYVAHLYVVKTNDRDSLREHLLSRGISTDVHYPIPDYQQTAYRKLFDGAATPVAEQACREVLTIPCFPEITDDEIYAVIDGINSW